MTLITTTFTPEATPFPFIGPAPSQELWGTIIPRGEVDYVVSAGAITVAGVGDDQRAQVFCNLPRGFGYVMSECSAMIEGGDVAQWDNGAIFRLRDDNGGDQRWTVFRRFEASSSVISSGGTTKSKIYELLQPVPSKVIICDRPAAGQLAVLFRNITTDQDAGLMNFFARFLQYDLNQAFRWAVNSPFPVR